nr:exocyst complex component EXO70A1-like [Ipomoea batatas]
MGIAHTHHALTFLFFPCVLLIIIVPTTGGTVSDGEALLKLKKSFNNAAALDSWRAGTEPCDKRHLWIGVICVNDVVTGLRLGGMGLSGKIDVDALSQIHGLRTLTLMHNSFAGSIPEFNHIGALKALYISKNKFSGVIPPDYFAKMRSMKKIWFSDNNFTGAIPSSLARLPRIMELHLENNHFSGKIPEFKQKTLHAIELANNNLQGEIPASLARFNDSSFHGNPGLCGAKIGKPCNGQHSHPSSPSISHGNSPGTSITSDSNSRKISLAIMGFCVFLLGLMVVGIVILKRRQERNGVQERDSYDDPSSIGFRLRSRMSAGELSGRRLNSFRRASGSMKRAGSNNGMGDLIMVNEEKGEFGLQDLMKAAAEVIGNGTLSSSYKATMTNGTAVVVKRIKEMNKVGKDGFDVELRRLGGLRHRNILPPLGYHFRQDEKLLVYEYMPKGSLLYALHGDRGIWHSELSWAVRLKIIRGVARGLGYLHNELTSYQAPHGDLQSNNILLTEDYEAVISDYGYVSLINTAQAPQALLAFRSPEGLQYNKVTPKSDVYCLGIVILEVVTGKFPSQYLNNGNGGTDVVQWVKTSIGEGREPEVFDPEIAGSESTSDQMRQLLHIGVACADSNPEHRIALREVIRRIEEIPTSSGEGAPETRTTESMPSLRDGYADQIEQGRGVAVVRDGAEVSHLFLLSKVSYLLGFESWILGSGFPIMEPPGNDAVAYDSAEQIILRWDSTASEDAREKMIFGGDRQEIDLYLSAVDEIQRSMESASLSDDQSKANSAIQIAMARLEDEFRSILIAHTSPIEAESLLESSSSSSRVGYSPRTSSSEMSLGEQEFKSFEFEEESSLTKELELEESRRSSSSYRSMSSFREIDLMPLDAIHDLRSIAVRMISAGYLRECVQVYGSVRKSAVDASFRKLGIEKLSIGDIQRLEWEALETKIRRWIRAAKLCVRILFASEKKLCEQIFEGLGTATDDAYFTETIKGPAIQLFNFAEAISISRRSPEKLFKILDLHDALSDLLPDIEIVFESKSSESIRVQATEILSRLGEAVRGILSEFENAVLREPSRVPVPGGTIHPLTRYVMNYISLISDYKQTLVELIVSNPSTGSRYSSDPNTPDMDFTEAEGQTPLALHLIWIIVILQFNLDAKSKHYKDTSLAHLFMMNNVHYIVQKIKGSPELREMIGDDYLRKLTGKFRQAATNYQRSTWVRVLYCLRDEGLHVGSFSSGVSKTALRERFKTFNAMFEEVHRTQSTWLIPDTQLREELRISMSERLIPAYRSFLGRFRSHIESGRHPENYIKYSVEDLENAVLDFFEGNPVSQHLRRAPH